MAFVRIRHPKVAGEATVSERALRHLEPKGWTRTDTPPMPEEHEPAQPARNATTDEWRTYAIARGMTTDQAASMGRDELIAHTSTEES